MRNPEERYCLIAAFGLPAAIYFYTAAPGVFWEDSASFSMAAATLSMAHSPGFPLWVLIGKLFTWLIPSNPARATNLMCALFGAASSALFFLCVNKVLTRLSGPFASEGNRGAPAIAWTALGAALVFAFSQTVWLQAVRAEVYSLQLFLTLAVFLIALMLPESEHPTRLFLLAVFLWGLSAAVHPLLTLSVLPGLLMMGYFRSLNWRKEISKWGWAAGLIFLAATVYLFLPIRSTQNPYFNWNHPDSWGQFIAVTSRYPDWQTSAAATASNISYPNAMRMISFLVSEYTAVFWILAAAGILTLARRLPRWGVGVFALLLSNLLVTLWATQFNARNLDLLGYLSFGMGIAILAGSIGVFATFLWLAARRERLAPKIVWGVPVTAGAMLLLMAGKSWGRADLHHSCFPDDTAREILRSLPSRSVVVLWTDKFLTPLMYAQGALNLRPDVVILPSDFFVWPTMAEELRRRYPDLIFEPAQTGNTRLQRMRQGFKNFCRDNRRPIYSELGRHIFDWKHFGPSGYLARYREEGLRINPVPAVNEFVNSLPGREADFVTRQFTAREIFNWGAYLNRLGAPEGERLQDQAVRLDGGNARLWADLGKTHLFSRRYGLAATCFKLSLACDPYEAENYFHLAFVLDALGKGEEARAARSEGDWLTGNKLKPMGQEDEKANR